MAGIRDVDRGARLLIARLRGLKDGAKLTMGIHSDTGKKAHPSGGTIARTALFIEFGTDNRAPVSFIRATIDEQRGTLAKQLADAGAKVLSAAGGQVEAFGPVAAKLARDMRARVPVDTATVRDAVEARVNAIKVT